MKFWDKLFGRAPSPLISMTSEWADPGSTTAEPLSIKKPINIQRSMLREPRYLSEWDDVQFTITRADEHERIVSRDETPIFHPGRNIVIDSVTKFEVVDEFGVDVGIGFVLGEAKK